MQSRLTDVMVRRMEGSTQTIRVLSSNSLRAFRGVSLIPLGIPENANVG